MKTELKSGKTFTLTLNNWTKEEEQMLKDFDCLYMAIGHEVGANGTPHLQAFMSFKTTKRPEGLKKICPRGHWENSIDEEAAHNYCLKDLDYFVKDVRCRGKRTDLENAIKCLKENGMKEMKQQFPIEFIKYHKGLEKLIDHNPRDFKPYVEWIYGPTGAGKTKSVWDKEKNNCYISNKNLQWWDGYENEEAVLIDDFRGDFCTFHELLRILDRYPYKVAVKGGFKELNSKRMYITSCYHPTEVYSTREDINQLIRRIDKVTKLL